MIAVGVDAGASRTTAVAQRDGEVLEPASGGPANVQSSGVDRAAAIVSEVVLTATRHAAPDAIVAGIAGGGVAATSGALTAALAAAFPGARVAVTGDAHIALRGAIPDGDGIALVAGTGSIAYAEIGASVFRAGGFGYLAGDEGSGYAIGAAALRSALRALDDRAPKDDLAEIVALRFGNRAPRDVVAELYAAESPVAAIASLAKIVLEAADGGSRGATKIVQTAALELFELVRAVCRRASVGERELPLALCGGLLTTNSLLTFLLESRIANELPHLSIVKNPPGAHFGALREALAMLEAV